MGAYYNTMGIYGAFPSLSPSMSAKEDVSSLTIGHWQPSMSAAAFTGRVFWTLAGEVHHFSRNTAGH